MGDAGYRVQEESLIRSDITEYLKRHEDKDLLRFLTCGSVDDGKSTLIGRLLFDCHMIYEDQLDKVAKDSKIFGTTDDGFDPALLTDGLKAEREQGITIDVAYRYFSTDKRKFIIADCPGHEQYTRNMATGASNCNLAVILIDARKGVIPQTKRHSFICSLLGIRHVVVAVNKMDLVAWSQKTYEQIMKDFNAFVTRLGFSDIHFIPMSALQGDNVVEKSDNLNWYDGPTFLHHIETLNISTDRNLIDMRLPVQYVLRPDQDFRGFSGTLAGGVIHVGDEVATVPSRHESRVKAIYGPDGEVKEAFAPMSVTVTLEDEIDVSRGDMLAPVRNLPHVGNEFEAMVVWTHEEAAEQGRSYLIKHGANMVPGVLSRIRYRMDVNTMQRQKKKVESLQLNEIGRCHLTLHRPIPFDPYDRCQQTGAFVIVDRISNATVGAGMIIDRVVSRSKGPARVSRNIVRSDSLVSPEQRREMLGQNGVTVWLTGLSASGKSTIARQLEKQLTDQGRLCYILDGDNVRHGLNRDLGFSMEDRQENIRRIAEVAALMNEAGIIVITAFISPYRRDRGAAREVIGEERFIEAYVNTPLEVCEARDPKGLYKKARAGEIRQFTGISDSYEPPLNAAIELPTQTLSVDEAAEAVIESLRQREVIV
ncbi:MAG: sulfate adenylyltransferase subunit CysN [Gammaproteobacteria bacterium]|nr:sulfate adenylyltransferase subunit CysN [Gammaproteobacteria bacterium]MBT8049642.1 sulfate adenylyltransferase subunit CysN [Gammaproteobacteria bacterium]MBT8055790.1 sulfate adenylyltransferase subunit CysN [Gammaproteobacteria bacterium]